MGSPCLRGDSYFLNRSRRWPRFMRASPRPCLAAPFVRLRSLPVSAPPASLIRPRTLSRVPPALSRPLLRIVHFLPPLPAVVNSTTPRCKVANEGPAPRNLRFPQNLRG